VEGSTVETIKDSEVNSLFENDVVSITKWGSIWLSSPNGEIVIGVTDWNMKINMKGLLVILYCVNTSILIHN